MLPGLISWHLGSSLSFILVVFVSSLHDYAGGANLETHPRHSLYKSGANEEIRGKARQDYLNAVGLLDSFQWLPEQDVNVTHKKNDIR